LEGQNWRIYTPENSGLPYPAASAIVSDGGKGLWIAYENGRGLAHLGFPG